MQEIFVLCVFKSACINKAHCQDLHAVNVLSLTDEATVLWLYLSLSSSDN